MQIKVDEYQTLFLWELLSDLISAPESKQHDFVHVCSCRKNTAARKVEMIYSVGNRPADLVAAWTVCSSAAEDVFCSVYRNFVEINIKVWNQSRFA